MTLPTLDELLADVLVSVDRQVGMAENLGKGMQWGSGEPIFQKLLFVRAVLDLTEHACCARPCQR